MMNQNKKSILAETQHLTESGPAEPSLNKETRTGLRHRLAPLNRRQINAWRAMEPARRLEMAFQAYQFALDTVRLTERQHHADLTPDEFAWRVTRRMQGDLHLGR